MQSSTETGRYEPVANSGDVDSDGEIVDRLQGAGVEGEDLASVLRLIAAGRALDAAAYAETRWSL
jgi:hypothetical protein